MWLPACFLLLLLPLELTSQPQAAHNNQTSIDCNLYSRRSGAALTTVLDCRRVAAQFNEASGYHSSRRALVLVLKPDLPVWSLSPPLSSNESINYLPKEAFVELGRTVTTEHLLSLRRLHQRRLNLSAASRLPWLRHLEVADSNATCLPVGLLDDLQQLVSLRLTDNTRLACIQAGALASLTALVELRISGSPRLKSLDAASAPQLTDLRLADATNELMAGALCGARALRQLRLDRLPADPLLLAGLSGLQSLHVGIDTEEEIVASLSAALCAQWSDGRLTLNGINLTGITGHMSMTFAEFCEGQGQREFAEQAKQVCETFVHAYVCLNYCPLVPTSTPTPTMSTLTTSRRRSIDSTKFIVTPKSSIHSEMTSAPTSSPRSTSTSKSSSSSQSVSGVVWNVEHQSVVGTALLTAGAFLVGALVTAYFCQSRRLRRHKPPTSATAVGVGDAGCGGGVGCVSAADEPIRLIGYTLKEAPPPLLQPPARRATHTTAAVRNDGAAIPATVPLITVT